MRRQRVVALTLVFLVIVVGLGTPVAAQDRASAVDLKGKHLENTGDRKWLKGILLGAVVGVTILDAAALLILIPMVQGKRGPALRRLEISNTGNVRSCYELRAEDPQNALRFRWRCDSINGVERAAMEPTRRASGGNPRAVPRAVNVVRPTKRPGAADLTEIDALRRAARSPIPEAVRKDEAPVTQLGHRLVSAFGLRRPVVSRPLATTLLGVSSPVHSAQREVKRATWISSMVSQAASVFGLQGPTAPSDARHRPRSGATQVITHTTIQTLFVEPGESLTFDLLIDPVRPYRTQVYTYKVISRSIEPGPAGPDPSRSTSGSAIYPTAVVVAEDKIRIAGLSGLGRRVPSVVILGVTIAILYLVFRLGSFMSVW
jgi:hypothetical protein